MLPVNLVRFNNRHVSNIAFKSNRIGKEEKLNNDFIKDETSRNSVVDYLLSPEYYERLKNETDDLVIKSNLEYKKNADELKVATDNINQISNNSAIRFNNEEFDKLLKKIEFEKENAKSLAKEAIIDSRKALVNSKELLLDILDIKSNNIPLDYDLRASYQNGILFEFDNDDNLVRKTVFDNKKKIESISLYKDNKRQEFYKFDNSIDNSYETFKYVNSEDENHIISMDIEDGDILECTINPYKNPLTQLNSIDYKMKFYDNKLASYEKGNIETSMVKTTKNELLFDSITGNLVSYIENLNLDKLGNLKTTKLKVLFDSETNEPIYKANSSNYSLIDKSGSDIDYMYFQDNKWVKI